MRLYNSLTQQKETHQPLTENTVKLYVCGMTVYDHCHIGHARPMVVFDVLVRYLRSIGKTVYYARNITDIDDKIIQRAAQLKLPFEQLTAEMIASMHQDQQALGLLKADMEPRATEFLPQMIDFVSKLIDQGVAYVAGGDVYFSVEKFPDYGCLSKRNIEDLQAGARVEVNQAKRSPLDFALWKSAKPGEPSWSSPWGEGRPGWHLECSVMSTELLGVPFDIHGGGMDLKFPHHENEIAQSEACYHQGYANTWMHVGLLQVDGEKMSKSLGNFVTIKDALKQYHPEVLRYFMLSGHYRSPVNYTQDTLQGLYNSLSRWYNAIKGVEYQDAEVIPEYIKKFAAAMQDDLNTPEVFAICSELTREINRCKESEKSQDLKTAAAYVATLKQIANTLGLLQEDPQAFLQGEVDDQEAEYINRLIAERKTARQQKNWQRADEIRNELEKMRVVVEDAAGSTTWYKEKI